jgi:hypothetical protein
VIGLPNELRTRISSTHLIPCVSEL